jgi:thiol-disulfide isomerase/thioredoxin
MKQQSIAIVLMALPTLALCFSPTLQQHASSSSALSYRDYDGIHLYDDVVERTAVLPQRAKSSSKHKAKKNSINSIQSKINYDSHLFDVESDRTSLRTLLDPPAAPFIPIKTKEDTVVLQTPEERARALRSSSSRATRATPTSITSLYKIQDYQEQILNSSSEYELSIVRFKAPWCQTCRTTNLAWERMASRLSKASTLSSKNKVKFYQVELDGKEDSTALKDFLEIEGVPQGVMHIPTLGVVKQKVKLHRKNLTQLKKNLDRFLTVVSRTPTGDDGLQGGMLLDGLREEE